LVWDGLERTSMQSGGVSIPFIETKLVGRFGGLTAHFGTVQ